jgi:hypothetical protein
LGIDFLNSTFGEHNWKQTSFNGTFRKNYASIGYSYDENRDAFIPEKPFNSWILNENTCQWEAPIEHPDNNTICEWDEDNKQWINCQEILTP